jgi:hypothetical protein
MLKPKKPSFSILDAPASARPDPDEFVQAAMQWHFSEETGSAFWLSKASSLGFDPRHEVKSTGDLARFPNIVNELRDVPAEDLIPRGYKGRPDVVSVFESGGTTGAPKRVTFLADWVDLLDKAADARAWLGGDAIVDELGDGSAALRPAVHQVDRSGAPQVKVELPFPCVWVAPWRPEEGVAPLRDSLVVTAITGHTALVDELIGEATISNVYVGDHPTCWFAPGIPHDDYLSSFLMRAKAVIT